MKQNIETLKEYLDLTLGLNVKIQSWQNKNKMPFYLQDLYDFYEMSLLKHTCILMVAKEETEITPGTIEKHKMEIREKWPGLYIYVHRRMSPHNRSRLIQNRASFIIPGNQMYLPEFGIDLREHFKTQYKKGKKLLSPATQATIIYLLVMPHKKQTPSMLAKQLGYSIMSMTRAFNELKAANLGNVQKAGRELYWTVEDKKELWEQAKEIMQNPVKNRVWLKKIASLKKNKVLAGLSALSYYSMLALPKLPIYAIGFNDFKNINLSNDEILPSCEDAAAELEIWQYNPNLFQQEGYVDPFSLYLSLKEHSDERIEAALEEMMEKMKW